MSAISDELFIEAWHRTDLTLDQIAAATGKSRQMLTYRAKKMGLPGRRSLHKTIACHHELARLWDAGVCSASMARYFGYTQSGLVTACHRMGCARRRPPGGRLRMSVEEFYAKEMAAE